MKKFSLLLAAAAALVSTVASAEVYQPKAGEVVIHYYRPDGAYGTAPCTYDTCWGIHAWGDAYEFEGQWTKPEFAKGTDDFGAYFVLPANSDAEMLKNAYARFIIHKAQLKDMGGKDAGWEVKEGGTNVFIVNNDCRVHYTLEAANQAKANPVNDCKEAVTY